MKKSLISNSSKWIDLAGNWSRCSSDPSEYFSEGVIAASNANNILYNAPSDVGGTINLGVTMSDVNELLRRWEIMQNYTNGIHYEIAELVDLPYTDKASRVMDDIFSLDPKNFRTKKDFLYWKRGKSLSDLLLSEIKETTARKSYETLVKTLDTDKPDAKFDEVIKDANYWTVELEKIKKIRTYSTEFYNKHNEKWHTYTSDKKIKLLNEYGKEIGEYMENSKWYDFIIGHEIVTTVAYASSDPGYNPSSQAYGYTYSQSRDGKVYLSDKFGNSDDPMFSLSFAMTTVIHEARHQYQGQAHYDPKRYNLPKYEQTEWFDRIKYPDSKYWTRPWEIDARAYAGLAF